MVEEQQMYYRHQNESEIDHPAVARDQRSDERDLLDQG